ncbi:MAG: acyl carrier protein [Rhodobiaceae bacterium]|nr:acyl carrier protein [Rhodobiaceae bacterium]
MTDEDTRGPAPTTWPQLDDPDMIERIIKVIVEEGKVERDKIAPEATLQTLGLESIEVVMVLMGLEEEFDTYIPMSSDLSEARNLSELISVIVASMQSEPAAPTSGG